MSLENDTWYWISDPREGDIYYPVYVCCESTNFQLDGKYYAVSSQGGATFTKAIMPINGEQNDQR